MEVEEAVCSQYVVEEAVCSQYVERLRGFSSQYGSNRSYNARNIEGIPANLGRLCDAVSSLVFRTYGSWWDRVPSNREYHPVGNTPAWFNSLDFLDLEFSVPVYPTKIYIYQTFCPGALVRILISDLGTEIPDTMEHLSRWRTVWRGGPVIKSDRYNIFIPKLPKIKKKSIGTKLIRLEFNSRLCEYYTELDACKLEGYKWSKGKKPSTLYKKRIFEKIQIEVPTELLENLKIEDNRDVEDVDESLNYFTLLPLEVVYKICGYLPLECRRAVALVNTVLHSIITDCSLYREINLRPYWKTLTSTHLEALLPTQLQRLDLSWTGTNMMVSSASMIAIISTLPNLTELRLNNCQFVNQHLLDIISSTCSYLKVLDLRHCGSGRSEEVFVLSQLSSLSTLEYINISDIAVSFCGAEQFFESVSELKWFIASGTGLTGRSDAYASEIMNNLALHCNKLCGVNMWRWSGGSHLALEAMVKCLGHSLKEIDVGWLHFQDDSTGNTWVKVAEYCPNLEVLGLTAIRKISDNDLHALASHCPNLKQLDLLGCGASVELVGKVLSECRAMEWIDLSYCNAISITDVANLQATFPHVSIKHASTITSRDPGPCISDESIYYDWDQ